MEMESVFQRWRKEPVNLGHDLSSQNIETISEFLGAKIAGVEKKAESDPDGAFGELLSVVTFGTPMWIEAGEGKASFLTRARDAVLALKPKEED